MDKLNKYNKGVIHTYDENGHLTDDLLVSYEFHFNLPMKHAAQLLVKRLIQLQEECDRYNLQ